MSQANFAWRMLDELARSGPSPARAAAPNEAQPAHIDPRPVVGSYRGEPNLDVGATLSTSDSRDWFTVAANDLKCGVVADEPRP